MEQERATPQVRINRIRGQLAALSRELDELEDDVAGPGPLRSTAPHPPQRPRLFPGPAGRPPVHGPGQPAPSATPPRPGPDRDQVLALALSLTGAAVLLVGVVLVLLGGSTGTLPRAVAVALAAGLSGLLLGLGIHLRSRRGDDVGAVALTGGGFAGLFLTAAATSTAYSWVGPVVGLVLVGLVSVAGLGLARRWDHQPLAVLITLGAAVLAPLVTRADATTAVFLAALATAALVAETGRRWPALFLAATVPAALVMFLVAAPDVPLAHIGMGGLALAGVVGASLDGRRPATAWQPVVHLGTCLSVLPLVLGPSTPGLLLVAVAAWAGALTVARRGHRRVLGLLGALTTVLALHQVWDEHLVAVVLLTALALLVLTWRTRIPATRLPGQVTAAAGLLLAGVHLLPARGVESATATYQVQDVVDLALAQAVVVLLVLVRLQSSRPISDLEAVLRWVGRVLPAGALLVAGGTVAGRWAGDGETGFLVGHLLTTVTWVGVAVLLLVGARHHHQHGRVARLTGLALVVLGLTKLFVFDLANLGTVTRLAAFLGVGALLVVVGVLWNSRRTGDDAPDTAGGTGAEPAPPPRPSGPPPGEDAQDDGPGGYARPRVVADP